MSSPGQAVRSWSTSADVVRVLRRSWDDGSLPAAYVRGEAWVPRDVPLRGPRAAEVPERLADVRAWIGELEAGARRGGREAYRIEHRPIGGRAVGSNCLPARVWIDGYDQAWALLGVRAEVGRFAELVRRAEESETPWVAPWMVVHPRRTLAAADVWALVLPALAWLARSAGNGMYLRQIDVPGIDTKVIEGQRALLGELLALGPAGIAGLAFPRTDLEGRYGFARKPAYLRMRTFGDPLGLPSGLTEVTLRVDEAAGLTPTASRVFVVENEVTYLAFPHVEDAIVVFGGGYDLTRLGRLPWLHDVELRYWSDLDTHGFVMLDRLRGMFPRVSSFLMDRQTLLAHETQWVRDASPVNAALGNLTAGERELYADLVENALGSAVRLEQERVNYAWIREAVSA